MTFFAAESFFYHGMARWDFGLDSPNKAAAVLAFLLLPLLALAVRARREWVRWCAGLASVPADVRRLSLCGRAADAGPDLLARFTALEDVRVISPNRPEDWLATRGKRPYIRVFCGEFAPTCPAEDADGLTVVFGAADYLPNWPRLAFGKSP